MKALKSQACVRSVRVRVVELPQFGSLHRHLVVPLDVVPFFFICPAHTGHRGLFYSPGKHTRECLMVCVWVPNLHEEMDQNDYCGETRSG